MGLVMLPKYYIKLVRPTLRLWAQLEDEEGNVIAKWRPPEKLPRDVEEMLCKLPKNKRACLILFLIFGKEGDVFEFSLGG